MAKIPVPKTALLLAGQVALTVVVTSTTVMMPDGRGPVLLIPVTRQSARELAATLFDGKARILAAGPVRGSFVVLLAKDRAWRALVPMGVLPLAYGPRTCGAASG